MHFDLLIRDGTCVFPWGEAVADIGVVDGRIVHIGSLSKASADEIFEAAGLHVLPGMIDSHVHLRDPGDPAVETLETGTRAAILGGVTTVFDMPNTNPAIDSTERLEWKRGYAENRAWCDIGLYVAGTKDNIDRLAALEAEPGVCAIKVFAGSSTAALMVEDDESLESLMSAGRRRIAFHSEDEYRLQERKPMFQAGMPHRNHMEWRDVECAFLGTRRLMALARKTGRRVHVLHVSTAEELDYMRDYRDVATVELLVNHLTQVAPECYDTLGGFGVMNPPIRDERHREASWQAVRDGRVDTIGSDHAPHSRAAKEKPWPDCPAGLTGVQTVVPIMLDHVNAGRLSLTHLAQLMGTGPSRVYGLLGKGRIAAGYDGDFTIVDMKRRRMIEDSWIASPCGWTPFAGKTVTGWPVATIIRGRPVMREDEVIGAPAGRMARFQD